jgi:hypothetical protein
MKKSGLGVGRYGVFILLMLVPFAQAIAQHTTNDIWRYLQQSRQRNDYLPRVP